MAVLLASSCVFAQSERDESHDQFAQDLAELQQAVQAANATLQVVHGFPYSLAHRGAVISRTTTAHELPSTDSEEAGDLARGSEVQVLGGSGAWARVLVEDKGRANAVWVHSDALTAKTTPPIGGGAFDTVIRQVRQFVDQYRTNPYVEVTGFSTTLSLTGISLSVQFKLK